MGISAVQASNVSFERKAEIAALRVIKGENWWM
jgi:hypothetical protein